MNVKSTTVCLAFAMALSLCGLTAAHADDLSTPRGRVLMLLMAYDAFPKAADFKAVAQEPKAHLLDIYGDTSTSHGIRLQALDALSLMPDEEVLRLYLDILGGCWAPEAARECHRALSATMHGFGAAALEHAALFLDHPDLQMRLTAAHVIARSGGDVGREILAAHLDKESSKLVREKIERETRTLLR